MQTQAQRAGGFPHACRVSVPSTHFRLNPSAARSHGKPTIPTSLLGSARAGNDDGVEVEMALKARLTLIAVVGLLLVAASVVYTGNVPWPAQAQAATSGQAVSSGGGSCGAGGGSCSAGKKEGSSCSASGGSSCGAGKEAGIGAASRPGKSGVKTAGVSAVPKKETHCAPLTAAAPEWKQAKVEACAKRHAEGRAKLQAAKAMTGKGSVKAKVAVAK